jgi:nickel-dependent lactate racemase
VSHVPREQITLINALGTHRTNTDAELAAMLGDELVRRYRVIQHDCDDEAQLTCVGTLSSGEPLYLNRTYASASVRILTGLIEPHFFAGFSGGPKAVLPGIASRDNIMRSHSADLIAHPKATWGVTGGNPIFAKMSEAARLSRADFLLNVSVNKAKEITGVFAGDPAVAHERGSAFVGAQCRRPVPHSFDVVLTTNAGYPLDQNLYQTIKGIYTGAQVVREGGAIIVAAECRDGIPAHGNYGRLLTRRETPAALLELFQTPGFSCSDQWQVQIQAQIQTRARVYVKSDYLTDEAIVVAHLIPCHSVEATLAELGAEFGPDATFCVLPQGPETVPFVQTPAG